MLELLNHEFILTVVEVNPDSHGSIFNIRIFGNIFLKFFFSYLISGKRIRILTPTQYIRRLIFISL